MIRLFLVLAFMLFPIQSFSLNYPHDFSVLTKINTAATNLTVLTTSSVRSIRLPFITSFDDIGTTATTGLTATFGTNAVNTMAYGDSIFLIAGAGTKIASYDGTTFTDRSADFYSFSSETYNQAIFSNGAFYVSSSTAGGKFAKFDTTPADYLICNAMLNTGDTDATYTTYAAVNSLAYNGSYWLIGNDKGRLNRWDGCTSLTCATNLTAGLLATNASWVSNTISAISSNSSYWLLGGTNGMCTKYDGFTFTNLAAQLASDTTITTHKIKAITWNGSEFLVGTSGGQLARYNGSAFTSCTASVSSTNGGCFGTSDVNAIAWNGLEWVIGGQGGKLCVYDSTGTTPVTSDFTAIGINSTGTPKTALLSNWSTSDINALVWNGTTMLVGGATTRLNKTTAFYNGASTKTVVSTTVSTITSANRIYSVALNATAVSNGQTIAYFVSCDGGTNWQSINNNNSATIISNTGYDLRWRADMTGTWRTPKLTALSLDYLAMDQSILPAGLGGDILYTADNLTKLTVPPGTITNDVQFTISNVAVPPTSAQTPKTAIAAYDLSAKINATSTDITEFSKPLTLTIHWTADTGGTYVSNTANSVLMADATTSLAIAFWNGLHWIPMSTKITKVGNDLTLTAKISHFSKYAIVVASPTDIIATAEPNPFTPLSTSSTFNRTKITFPNPDQVTAVLKIWDRNGSLMREYSMDGVSQIEWDGKDSAGAVVESGVYFFEAIAGGTSRAKGTVVVGR